MEVGSGRFRTAGEIADWVESEYGVRFRGTAYTVCLSGWDVHRRFPDPGMIRRIWMRRGAGKRGLGRSLRRAGVSSGTLIGFADEMRVGLRGMVRRVWGVRGVKVVQRLQLVYEWEYLFLVVDFARGKLEWAWIDSMRSETVARAVLSVRRYTEVRALVWDGAGSHRSELVRSIAGGEDDNAACLQS